ncbi:unnamed protein product [Closterium sp. Naga37s-1]|nr:unnamed protein product [Closterium sp. Naga37s-1]
MEYKTHNNWIGWVMRKAGWSSSKVTHIFRRSGAQGLSDDRCPDTLIAKLGGWEQGEMRRSYLLGVPFEPVLLMAGYSGDPEDYYIGRAHAKLEDNTEWEELLELFRKHIYPWLEEEMAKVEKFNKDKKSHEKELSAEQFLKALLGVARVQDAIYRLQGTQQMTKLRLLNQELMENAGRVTAENGQLRMENKSLHEELALLKVAMAALQRGDDAPPCVASNGGAADPKTEVCDEKPEVETQEQEDQRIFFAAVLTPWLKCSKLSDAWKLWDRGTGMMGGRSIRDLAKAGDFLATYSEYGDQKVLKNTRSKRLGRKRNQMLTIDSLRPDDSEAATAYALALGDWLLGESSESAIGDGNVVTALQKRKREVAGDDGITANESSRNRIVYLLVDARACDEAWAESVVGAEEWPKIKDREAGQIAKKRRKNNVPPPEPYVGDRS